MKQQILELFTSPRDMAWQDILLNISISALLGFFIFLSYAISHRGAIYSRKFNASLVILTVLTGTVMTVIGNNIALSLGMVGALSIVRFRTAIRGQVYQLFRAKAILRVENTTEESVELIYELTQELLRRGERLTPDMRPGRPWSR